MFSHNNSILKKLSFKDRLNKLKYLPFEISPPELLICPLSFEIMDNPISISNHHSHVIDEESIIFCKKELVNDEGKETVKIKNPFNNEFIEITNEVLMNYQGDALKKKKLVHDRKEHEKSIKLLIEYYVSLLETINKLSIPNDHLTKTEKQMIEESFSDDKLKLTKILLEEKKIKRTKKLFSKIEELSSFIEKSAKRHFDDIIEIEIECLDKKLTLLQYKNQIASSLTCNEMEMIKFQEQPKIHPHVEMLLDNKNKDKCLKIMPNYFMHTSSIFSLDHSNFNRKIKNDNLREDNEDIIVPSNYRFNIF